MFHYRCFAAKTGVSDLLSVHRLFQFVSAPGRCSQSNCRLFHFVSICKISTWTAETIREKTNRTFEPSGPGRDPAKDKEWSSGLGMARDPSKLEERQEPERDLGGAPTRWTRNVL